MRVLFLIICLYFSYPCLSQTHLVTDTIFIYITKSDLHDLERQRLDILEKKNKQFKLTFVPCIVKYNNILLPSKIRMKGDRLIHFEEGNISYRIELNGNNFLMGMQKFSIHRPRVRNYVYENLFHYALKKEEIINLKYLYVRVYVNGLDLGIYALEQFMEKAVIESSRRREGPILHFSEDVSTTNIDSMEVQIFGKEPRDIHGNSIFAKQKDLLESYKQGKVKVSELFDIKKMADFLALTDVLGFHHAAVPKSIRLYCNPISGKFEPIGFDGHYGTENSTFLVAEMGINPKTKWYYAYYQKWFYNFFSNPEIFDADFFSHYISSLKRMSERKYLTSIFNETDFLINRDIDLLKKYSSPLLADRIFGFGPDEFKYSKEDLYKRQDAILDFLKIKSRVHAILINNKNGILSFGVRNIERLPVKLLSISVSGKKYPIDSLVLLPAVNWETDTQYSAFEVPINYNTGNLEIEYTVLGLNEPITEKVVNAPGKNVSKQNLLIKVERRNESELMNILKNFSFLSFSPKTKTVEFKPGYWELNKPLIVPPGYIVRAGPGVEINMKNSSYIVLHSPINFEGTETKKIKFFSTDSTGMGMLVCSDGRQNKMVHVEFSNLKEIITDRIKLTGAVTFYESPVNIYYCSFLLVRAEDALNIIRSDFELAWSLFERTFSDAFDGDFVKGKIQDCSFKHTGNDAIDGSGSIIKVERIIMKNIGDKGISSGEVSTIVAEDCYVDSANVGYASKDLSHLTLTNCYVSHSTFGLAAYQKKSQMGSSTLTANKVAITRVKTGYIIDGGSFIVHDSKKIGATVKDAVLMLYDDL